MPISFRPWSCAAAIGFLTGVAAIYFAGNDPRSLGLNPDQPAPVKRDAPASPRPAFQSAPQSIAPPESALAPVSADLLKWADRYLAASGKERQELLPAGAALARERRARLADLIVSDPEAALASALPRSVRSRMPAEITTGLEEIVSARASLEVIQSCLHPVGAAHDPAEDFYRATVIGDREYRVHVYGSRLKDASLSATSLHGIAIDGQLAVSDFRFRVLESGEALPEGMPALSPEELAVEADGLVTVLPTPEALPDFVKELTASEENPVVQAADSGPGASGVTGRPTQAWTHGNKKLLVIRVDFSDLTGTPINKFDGNAQITDNYVANVINGPSGVREFLQQNSFGKTDLLLASAVANDSPDVTQVFRMPSSASSYATAGNSSLLHTNARSAAAGAGYNLASYQRIAVVFTYLGDLPGSKINYGGLGDLTGPNLWINGAFDLRVVGHELGHNYGLHHANLWQVTDGNPVSPTGSSTEYGDPFDLMGDGDFSENHFSQWNKTILQWIPDSAVTFAGSSGTFRVHRFDSSTADLGLPRALKVVRDSTRDYWIGYRRATTSSSADNGATVIWGYNSNQAGNLLDLTTPGAGSADAPVALNTTFNDSAGGISIRPVAQGGSGADEWLDIQVTLQPRLSWGSTSYVVNEQGGSAVLTVNRAANASGSVSVNYATVAGTATAPADYATTNGTLTWANGDTAPKTVTVPIVADALVEGTQSFTVQLSSPVGGVVLEPTATVTIADPGARDTTFAANFINNTVNRTIVLPDGKILIAGWFDILQDINFVSYGFGRIARLKPNGAIDTDFNPGSGADNTVFVMERQPDGKILIAGNFTTFNGVPRNGIARLEANGTLDLTFNPGTGANGSINALIPLPDGDILIGGNFTSYNGTSREYLARLDENGSLDTGFTGPNFASTSGWRVESLALQTDGKILVGGSFYFSGSPFKAGLCRTLPTGAVDSTFNGISHGAHLAGDTSSLRAVDGIVVQPDGQILIYGGFTAFNNVARSGMARLTSTGALDGGFNPQPGSTPSTLLLLPDQSMLIGGSFTTVNGSSATRIARLSSGGVLDTAFAAAGGHSENVADLTLQPDGNVILAGDFGSFQGASPSRPVWRLVPGLSGAPGVIQFAVDATTATEGTNASVSVTRSGGSLGTLTVGYSTVQGSAIAGADFTTTAGSLTWANGDTTAKTIQVPIASDALTESPETFLVNLGSPLIGGTILADRQQATVTIEAASLTGFAAWKSTRFTPAELADPQISGDLANPDKDDLNNLMEYALVREPKTPDSAGAWTSSIQNVGGSDYLTVTFRRPVSPPDLGYTVQTGNGLSSGDLSGTAIQVGAAVPVGDGTETVNFRDTVARNLADRRFMRIKVVRTP